MVAKGNPLGIRAVGDLAQSMVRFVNREPGAALRVLLDDYLELLGIPHNAIAGYSDEVSTHYEGAQRVFSRLSDAALGLRVVATAFGLDFVPIKEVRCDLVVARDLMEHGCHVTVVPYDADIKTVLGLNPDGVFVCNGPGDPDPLDETIQTMRGVLEREIPLAGICLGHQLLGLALGGKRYKMRFGHRGINHPVRDFRTERILITTQNHGFAVDQATTGDEAVRRVRRDKGIDVVVLEPLLGTAEPATDYQGNPINWPNTPEYVNAGLVGQMEGSIAWHSPTTENPALDSTEEWEIWNMTGDAHPVHLHLVHFEVLGRE